MSDNQFNEYEEIITTNFGVPTDVRGTFSPNLWSYDVIIQQSTNTLQREMAMRGVLGNCPFVSFFAICFNPVRTSDQWIKMCCHLRQQDRASHLLNRYFLCTKTFETETCQNSQSSKFLKFEGNATYVEQPTKEQLLGHRGKSDIYCASCEAKLDAYRAWESRSRGCVTMIIAHLSPFQDLWVQFIDVWHQTPRLR